MEKGICSICVSHGRCELETPLVPLESCWKFQGGACDKCAELHPERPCEPPKCVARFNAEVAR